VQAGAAVVRRWGIFPAGAENVAQRLSLAEWLITSHDGTSNSQPTPSHTAHPASFRQPGRFAVTVDFEFASSERVAKPRDAW
jgi:hypothetical protein